MKQTKSKHLDSSIQHLKQMLVDQSNELESERKRALVAALRKLKKLKKQPPAKYEDIYRTVAEVAKAVLDASGSPRQSEDHS
jgi:phosphoenolpyruvate carboxylase